ncbi:MAG: ABC transporter ATP-binding protein [Acidimicrobiia bacterium]|nr:ABC transporter ATP-binding protein [Acidimicrobiia bacterium]
MTRPAIDVRDVGVTFRPYVDSRPTLRRGFRRSQREVVALRDVSFTVMRGEAFGVIGHNGAGKTTLLRVMAQTLAPTTGSVTVRGRVSTLLSLGVGFKPELSGRRNVYLGGLAQGLTRVEIDEMFDQIVEYAELEDAIDLPVSSYSSGMFARLAFSISMHLTPDIVLLDEILSVGDASFRSKSQASMDELLSNSGTIVFVSHSMPRVAEFCDRVAWLNGGTLMEVGPAAETVERYQDYVSRRRRLRESAPS